MALEIERRFLVDSNRLPKLPKGNLINQGYLIFNKGRYDPIVRVRIENKKATITFKVYISELTKDEFEYPIPIKDAGKLLKSCPGAVQKIRHNLKVGQHIWSIDFYEGENFPLVVAEVELKSETEKFEKPLWLKKEVSKESRFHAYSLAQKPFSTWRRSIAT